MAPGMPWVATTLGVALLGWNSAREIAAADFTTRPPIASSFTDISMEAMNLSMSGTIRFTQPDLPDSNLVGRHSVQAASRRESEAS
jgi:hypothetical protein